MKIMWSEELLPMYLVIGHYTIS